ncbi:LURP-one-like protein (DUF567) isoform X2 [Wolffia australiana]
MASTSNRPSEWEIPVDFTVRKGKWGLPRGELTIHDANGQLSFIVRSRRQLKTLVDAAGKKLITCVYRQGGWEAFGGEGFSYLDALFTTHKTVSSSSFYAELRVFWPSGSLAEQRPAFEVKGSPFQRSCTVYHESSVIAQASPKFKLGKVIYPRNGIFCAVCC